MDKNLDKSIDFAGGMGDMDINIETESSASAQETNLSQRANGTQKASSSLEAKIPKSTGNAPKGRDGGIVTPLIENDIVEMNHEERKALTNEQEMTVKDSVKKMEEISEGLQSLLIGPDGSPMDLTDKKGRAKLVDAINNTISHLIDYFDSLPDDITEKVSLKIPKSITMKFSDKAEKTIDFMRTWYRSIFGIAIAYLISIVGITYFALKTKLEADTQMEQAQELVRQARDIGTFGNFMREHNPKTWQNYENDMEFRKEVYRYYDVKRP